MAADVVREVVREAVREVEYADDGEDPRAAFALDCTEAGYKVEECRAGNYVGPVVRCHRERDLVRLIRRVHAELTFARSGQGYVVIPAA